MTASHTALAALPVFSGGLGFRLADRTVAIGIGMIQQALPASFGKLFRRHYHATPAEVLSRIRIERACERLLASRRSVADVAFEVGFETLSAQFSIGGTDVGPAQDLGSPTSGPIPVAQNVTLQDAYKAYKGAGGSFDALVTSLLSSDSFLLRTTNTHE